MGGFTARGEVDAHDALVARGELEFGRLAKDDSGVTQVAVERGGGEVQHAVAGRFFANDKEEGEVGGVDAGVGLGVEEGLDGVDLGRDAGFVVDGAAAGDE